jgi:hypothetical protein
MSDVPEISGVEDVGCVGAQLHDSDAIEKHCDRGRARGRLQ